MSGEKRKKERGAPPSPNVKTKVHTHCGECGQKLDAVTAEYARRYPHQYRTGILGRCCTGFSPADDRWDK